MCPPDGFIIANFNPRPPCGRRPVRAIARSTTFAFQPTSPVRETTLMRELGLDWDKEFQPTSPVRETTGQRFGICGKTVDFNPRPPCGRRRQFFHAVLHILLISTHVPRAGDDRLTSSSMPPERFQPTSPVRETTKTKHIKTRHKPISTHVPRAGDDDSPQCHNERANGFQPTSPVRETTLI